MRAIQYNYSKKNGPVRIIVPAKYPVPEGMKLTKPRLSKSQRLKKRKERKIYPRKPIKTWLEIHKEMLRWQKTDNFRHWQRKQFLKQGGTCWYCDEPFYGRRPQVEHIKPKSKGGDNNRSNLVLACATCNKAKNTTLLTKLEIQELRIKNKAKRGTYHKIQGMYQSEYQIAERLNEIF